MTSTPPTAYQSEYIHHALNQDEAAAIWQWAHDFVHAREDGRYDECRLLLRMVSTHQLTDHSRAMFLRCRALLAHAEENYRTAIEDYERCLSLFQETNDPLHITRVLNDLGVIYFRLGAYDRALELYQGALDQASDELSASPEAAMIRNNFGQLLIDCGRIDDGITQLQESAALFQRLGQPQGAARVEVNLGRQLRRQGHVQQALKVYLNALSTLEHFNDRSAQVDALNGLGVLNRARGDFDTAFDYYKRSLRVAQDLGDLDGQAQALSNMGSIYQIQRDYQAAEQCYLDALASYDFLGDQAGAAGTLGDLGNIYSLWYDDETRAREYYSLGLHRYQQIGDIIGQAFAHYNMGGSSRKLGDLNSSEEHYRHALTLAQAQRHMRLQASTLSALATVALMRSEWDEANALLREALGIQVGSQDIHGQVETTYKLGYVALSRGQPHQVHDIIEPALVLATTHAFHPKLVDLTWIQGSARHQMSELAAFCDFAKALAYALMGDDHATFDQKACQVEQYLMTLAQENGSSTAEEALSHMVIVWQSHEFAHCSGVALERFADASNTLPCSSPEQ